MKVLLLLAGRSRRFWPLSEKSLFPLCGKPLLQHQINRLQSAGLTDIVLVGGAHNLDEVRTLFPELPSVEQEKLDLGMRGALLSALPHCGNEPIMIVSGNDVIAPEAYKELAAKTEVDGALLAQRVQKYFPGGYLTMEEDRITGIVEKPGEGNEPSDLVNIVAHIHKDPQALLDALQDVDESKDDGYEQALQKLFGAKTYHAVAYDGTWQAVKFPWHILQLLPIFLGEHAEQQISPDATVHESAVITGPVVIEAGVKVMPHATIVGPCYVGKGSIIANNALVRGSSVGEHCVVGYNTEVKGSVLHSHVWTHMTYIGDSIIGRNVSFGGGSMTGNLRLDEGVITSTIGEDNVSTGLTKFGAVVGDNCRLGVHTTINPGVKIGQGTFVSSGVLVERDIADMQFARMRSGEMVCKDNSSSAPTPEDREEFRRQAGL